MKRILLIGEFSGLHTNLKEALQELGHQVLLVSAGDGKKSIARDIDISIDRSNIYKSFKSFLKNRKKIKNLKGFDIVQFINPYIQPKSTLLHYPTLFKNNSKIVCLAAGDDVIFSEFVRNNGMTKYSPFDDELESNKKLPYESTIHRVIQHAILRNMDLIIPSAYEYAESYRNSKHNDRICPTIPYPMNIDKIAFEEINFDGKIIIYHASNRPIFKGSKFINEALDIIALRYPDKVEVINAEFLPLKEYLSVINKAHIVIDQCRSYSYGMNALYSLAKGKIVLSGCEEECKKELDIENSPILNIIPNTTHIVNTLEQLILNKSELMNVSIRSREFVKNYHDYKKIAKRYLVEWEKLS